MALIYNKQPKKSPKDKSLGFYVTPKTIKQLGLRELSERVVWEY